MVCSLIHTSFIFMVKARLILFCDFSGFPWYCFDMRSCSLRVQPPTARICRVKYSLSSGAELMVNGCHSCGAKEEKWVIGYSLSEQHILTPINPKYNDWLLINPLHRLKPNPNTKTQILFLITFNICIHFQEKTFFLSFCFLVRVYKKVVKFSFKQQKILGIRNW